MKKRVKQLIVIILFILIIMFIKHIIKTNHKVEYKISKYKITENFKIINKKHQYTIKITNKDKVYTYILNKNMIGIIGCRQASEYGIKAAKYFSYNLSKKGIILFPFNHMKGMN